MFLVTRKHAHCIFIIGSCPSLCLCNPGDKQTNKHGWKLNKLCRSVSWTPKPFSQAFFFLIYLTFTSHACRCVSSWRSTTMSSSAGASSISPSPSSSRCHGTSVHWSKTRPVHVRHKSTSRLQSKMCMASCNFCHCVRRYGGRVREELGHHLLLVP